MLYNILKMYFFCMLLAILKRMMLWIRMNMHTIIQNNRKFLSTCILDFVNILFAQNHHLLVLFNMFFLFCSLSLKNKKDINKVDIVVLVHKEFKPFIGVAVGSILRNVIGNGRLKFLQFAGILKRINYRKCCLATW